MYRPGRKRRSTPPAEGTATAISSFTKYKIPTASYETFSDPAAAIAYLETAEAPIVIKADGLALGKGVVIAETIEEARDAVRSMMEDKVFGASGSRVVVEENF